MHVLLLNVQRSEIGFVFAAKNVAKLLPELIYLIMIVLAYWLGINLNGP